MFSGCLLYGRQCTKHFMCMIWFDWPYNAWNLALLLCPVYRLNSGLKMCLRLRSWEVAELRKWTRAVWLQSHHPDSSWALLPSPATPDWFGFFLVCFIQHPTPQPPPAQQSPILVAYSLSFPLSFLIFLSFLPDKCRNSNTFCLCYKEQFESPQPLAPNLFSDSIEVLSKAKSLSYNNIHTPLMLGVWTQTVQVFCSWTERTSVWHVAAPPAPMAGLTN